MVLGALAGNLWTAGYKSQAEAIVVKIEDKLGVHGRFSLFTILIRWFSRQGTSANSHMGM